MEKEKIQRFSLKELENFIAIQKAWTNVKIPISRHVKNVE